jgi:cell division protein FtsN
MEKYLQQILKEVNTIIIPGLGALTITNDKTGEVMFMSYLKYDDGKLSAYIAEKGNIDNDEAKSQISSYVENVLNTIALEGDFLINGVGLFSKDSNGDLCFENRSSGTSVENENSDLHEEIVDLTNIHEEEKVMDELVSDEPIVLANEITNDANGQEVVDVVVDDNCEKSDDEEIISSSNTELKEKELEEEPASAATIIVEENFRGEVVSDETESGEKEEKEIPESSVAIIKKKRGVGFFVILFFIILIASGGVAIGVNFKNVRQFIPFLSNSDTAKSEEDLIKKMELDKTKPSESDSAEGEDLIENPEEVISETTPEVRPKEDVVEEQPMDSKSSKRDEPLDMKQSFYIVVGSFSDRKNADRAVDKLIAEGQKDASTASNNGKFYVTIANYSNIDDAKSGQKSFKDSFPKAWILNP